MLATLLLLLFARLRACRADTVTNISASDPAIVLSPGWTNATDSQTGATLLQTSEFLSHLTATLPPSSSSVSYFGYGGAGVSLYGYSLDCFEDCVLQTTNGTDANGTDSAVAIFTLDLDPSTNHTLRVYNLGVADESSQITFDHLSVAVQNESDSSPGTGTPPILPTSSTAASTATIHPNTPSSTSSIAGIINTQAGTASAISRSSLTTSTSTKSSADTGFTSAASVSVSVSSAATASSESPTASGNAGGQDGSSSNSTNTSPDTSTSTGVSKRLVIGLTAFALAVTSGVLILLVVCLRRRRREQRGRFASSQRSSATSIIPIMEPPQMSMRFSEPPISFPEPFAVPQLDAPLNSPIMQGRQGQGRSPPNIPLPQPPPGARINRMEGRNSPASSGPRPDLWISRTPVKSEFFPV